MTAQFILAGLNISTAPVELLERVTVASSALPGFLPQLASHAGGGVLLSTCNRTEMYGEADDLEQGLARLVDLLVELAARSPDGATDERASLQSAIQQYAYVRTGDAVISHLFRVTAGLDSMALGEAQVAGQVADALKAAGEAGVVQPRVSRLFHAALRTSRRVRQKTGLGRDRVSVPSIGVQLIERSIGDLRTKSALLVGAGETGELVARALRTAGIGRLTVTSRRAERADALARELGASAVPFAYREFALAEADVLVTCTAATEKPVISAQSVATAMRARPARKLFIMDVGMPRDVDPQAAGTEGVTLRDLQGLETIAAEHRANRREAAAEAEALIAREVERFKERLTSVESEPVIRSLGAHAEAVRLAELQRALKRLPGLTPEQAAVIEAMSQSLVSRLLAEPISFVRESGSKPDAAEKVADIFGLDSLKDA